MDSIAWIILNRLPFQVLARMWRHERSEKLLVGCTMLEVLWKTVWQILKKLNVRWF